MPPPAIPPYSSRSSAHNHMYTSHASYDTDSQPRHTFPSPPNSGRRTSTSDQRLKPVPSNPPSSLYPFAQSQRRGSTPSATVASAYDSGSHRLKTTDTAGSRHVDSRFPGPLHIPPTPHFLASPSPSPHDSPASTLINTPRSAHYAFRSPSPTSQSSWRDPALSDKLPPIRHLHSPPGHKPPFLSTARWHEDPYSRYLHSPSPTPSSPESDEEVDTPRYTSQYASQSQRPAQVLYNRAYEFDKYDGSISKNYYPRTQDPERRHGNISSTPPPARTHATTPKLSSPKAYEDDDSVPSIQTKGKFGVRRGSRFFCTYVSPVTGERCDVWDKGWTVFATLSRHAETEHAPEELALITRGVLRYDEAQIITTREKQERVEENLAQTGSCPECGTVFSSKRRDSLNRHRQTSACEKAQKRGRPPTKFPKKPKGANFAIPEADSSGEAP